MTHRDHAVVLGASMAGLLAVRALSERFERVTLVERDQLPANAESRKGVPQGRHTHGLLSGGLQVLEGFFPGLTAGLLERGAQSGDTLEMGLWCIGGRALARSASGMLTLACSRPLLEAAVRARVLALPNVQLIDACDVLGLAGDAQRVHGARILRRADHSSEEQLAADLIVDCTGRGSRLPGWLGQLGLAAPGEERVGVDLRYVTFTVARRASDFGGARAVVIGAAPPNVRCGVALAIEHERWIVTLVGYFGAFPGTDDASLLSFARELPAPWIHQLLRRGGRLQEPVTAKFPHSQRRRYERLVHFPRGLLALGDALCSFNPIYGQGMSVAALEAKLLQHPGLDARDAWRRYFAAASRIIDTPWTLAVGNDLKFSQVEAARPRSARWVGAYMDRLIRAASVNPRVAVDFLKATQLVAPLPSLFGPAVALRALRYGGEVQADQASLPEVTGVSGPV